MTLTMAWVRTLKDHEELVFCSDSRLRFGCAWDSCQKIFPLPRGDCAIAFAGDTHFAYPFIHAAMNAVSLHRGSMARIVDLCEAKTFLVNAINAMLEEIKDFAKGSEHFEEPDLRLMLGGYSWRKRKFMMWKFTFDSTKNVFIETEAQPWKGLGRDRKLLILGDPSASPSAQRRAKRIGSSPISKFADVEAMARKELVELLQSRKIENGAGLNMEPMEVLRDIIVKERSPYVGGPPQLIKIYPYLSTRVFGMRWGDERRVAVLGRLLRHGEKMHVPILDPDTLQVEGPKEGVPQSTVDASDQLKVEVPAHTASARSKAGR